MRKVSSNNRSRGAEPTSGGIRPTKITTRPVHARQDKKIETMNLGAILSSNSIRRNRRRRRTQTILALISLMVLTIAASLLIRYYTGGDPGLSDDVSSDFSSSVLSTASTPSTPSDTSTVTTLTPSGSDGSSASVDPAVRVAAFDELKTSVDTFAASFDGRIGIYYINLTNDEVYGYGEKNPFVAASSIKMGIVTQMFKAIDEGRFELTQMLTYDNRPYPTGDLEYGTGIVLESANGTQYSIQRTAQLAITISDNCATNMIIRTLGGIDTIIPILNGISAEVPYRTAISYKDYKGQLVSGRHRTSAKDLALYARYFYELWDADKEAYAPFMDDLRSTVFTFGIQAKLPKSVPVAHKIGTNYDYRTENDVGIVFAQEPYILCVTTEAESQEAGRTAVADVSLMFYEYIAGLAK
jgi:beta-lactamase class A